MIHSRIIQAPFSSPFFVSPTIQAQDDARQQLREFEETKKQIEEDEDREIQDIKIKYERRLREERESNLRLKGETGIMRKKVHSAFSHGLCIFIYLKIHITLSRKGYLKQRTT